MHVPPTLLWCGKKSVSVHNPKRPPVGNPVEGHLLSRGGRWQWEPSQAAQPALHGPHSLDWPAVCALLCRGSKKHFLQVSLAWPVICI